MAARTISTTDTLEDLRLQFNALSEDDFGDIGELDPTLAATSVIGAVNELSAAVTAGTGFYLEDSSSTQQQIAAGQTLLVNGSTNINAVVSSPDTLTVSLSNDVTITGEFTASGSTHTLGTIEISGNTIRSTDSTRINVNDVFRANELETQNGLLKFDQINDFPRIQSTKADNVVVFDAIPAFNSSIIFEGSTADTNELTITATDPTADRTITIPDVDGVFVTTGDTGSVTSTMIVDDAVGQNQLKNVVALQILNSSGTVVKTIYGAGA